MVNITLLQRVAVMSPDAKLLLPFLADRTAYTNGRACATVLHPSVVCETVTYVLWLNSAFRAKVTKLTASRKLYMRNR